MKRFYIHELTLKVSDINNFTMPISSKILGIYYAGYQIILSVMINEVGGAIEETRKFILANSDVTIKNELNTLVYIGAVYHKVYERMFYCFEEVGL